MVESGMTIKAIADVRIGESVDGRTVIGRNRIDKWVLLDFGDSSPLHQPWYHKVDTDRPTHTTHIAHLPHMGLWQPLCDQCGYIGAGQRYEQDAVGIAERHQQIGGFER